MRRTERGFTLIQLVMVVIALGAASLIVARYVSNLVIKNKAQKTITKVLDLSRAIYGESNLSNTTQKFFLGDMLRLPTSLAELTSNINSAANWDGPYWDSGSSGIGNPEEQLALDAFGRTIGWVDSSGTLSLHADTRAAISSVLGADILTDLSYILTPIQNNMDDLLYGHIIGTVRDTTGYTFPHPWHKQKVLLSLQYLGNAFVPVDVNLLEEREVFRQHYHGWRFDRNHPDGDIEVEDENYDFGDLDIPVVKKVGKKTKITLVFNDSWASHDHKKKCPFQEDADALADLIRSFDYLTLPYHYTEWQDHLRADKLAVDGESVFLGDIKHTLDSYTSGYDLTTPEMQDMITIHPEVDGRFYFDSVPVGNYVITAYDHYLLEYLTATEKALLPGKPMGMDKDKDETLDLDFKRVDEALKRYVTVRPDRVTELDFKFQHYFPGHDNGDVADPGTTPFEATYLTYQASSWYINGTTYTGLTIGSSNTYDNITITKVNIYWDKKAGDKKDTKLEVFSIGGTNVWTGSKKSVANLNITDTVLPPGAYGIPIVLSFKDDKDDGGEVQFLVEFSDASATIMYAGGTLRF